MSAQRDDNLIARTAQWYDSRKEELLQAFFTFLRFPSISTDPAYRGAMVECASWLKSYLQKIGLTAEEWPTPEAPTLFAYNLKAGPSKPTVPIYHHYDVQPVDPLEAWQTPPFEPAIRAGEVYARGAQDNKGQCFYTLQALHALMATHGELPVNIKLCIEGGEECGSSGLSRILAEHSEALQADYLVICDLDILAIDRPAVVLGIRGISTMDVEVQGAKGDLHSGCHGGIVYNPIHALAKLLAALHDPQGKVNVPGFYDAIQPMTAQERSQISLDFDAANYEKTHGVKPMGGEKELSPLERCWLRPTLEINGISGGYAGPGFKTVLPAKASAKISCRLVSAQDPQHIGRMVAQFLQDRAPEGVQVKVHLHPAGGRAVNSSPFSPGVKAFAAAFEEVFQKRCEFVMSGGSIPIVAQLQQQAGDPEVILVGLGLPDDQIHAPNEHFGIDRLRKGRLVMARAFQILAKQHAPK